MMIFDEMCRQDRLLAGYQGFTGTQVSQVFWKRPQKRWGEVSGTILFSPLFEFINLRSLNNFLMCFWSSLKRKVGRLYIWRYRDIKCTEVLQMFWRTIGFYSMALERIDIGLASAIKIEDLKRWIKFCKINYDPLPYQICCTPTDWTEHKWLTTWNIQIFWCRLSTGRLWNVQYICSISRT